MGQAAGMGGVPPPRPPPGPPPALTVVSTAAAGGEDDVSGAAAPQPGGMQHVLAACVSPALKGPESMVYCMRLIALHGVYVIGRNTPVEYHVS